MKPERLLAGKTQTFPKSLSVVLFLFFQHPRYCFNKFCRILCITRFASQNTNRKDQVNCYPSKSASPVWFVYWVKNIMLQYFFIQPAWFKNKEKNQIVLDKSAKNSNLLCNYAHNQNSAILKRCWTCYLYSPVYLVSWQSAKHSNHYLSVAWRDLQLKLALFVSSLLFVQNKSWMIKKIEWVNTIDCAVHLFM